MSKKYEAPATTILTLADYAYHLRQAYNRDPALSRAAAIRHADRDCLSRPSKSAADQMAKKIGARVRLRNAVRYIQPRPLLERLHKHLTKKVRLAWLDAGYKECKGELKFALEFCSNPDDVTVLTKTERVAFRVSFHRRTHLTRQYVTFRLLHSWFEEIYRTGRCVVRFGPLSKHNARLILRIDPEPVPGEGYNVLYAERGLGSNMYRAEGYLKKVNNTWMVFPRRTSENRKSRNQELLPASGAK